MQIKPSIEIAFKLQKKSVLCNCAVDAVFLATKKVIFPLDNCGVK